MSFIFGVLIRRLSLKVNFISCRHLCIATNSASNAADVDIVISGGGMVGCCMACVLAYKNIFANKRIMLLEAASEKEYCMPVHFSNRTCALSPSTVQLLKSFGAWSEIEKMRLQPVHRMQVWDSCSDSMIGFSNEDINNPLAYIVENDVIMAALKRRLNCAPNKVNVHFNSFPKSFHNIGAETREMPSEHTWLTIGMNSEDKVHTQLLIGADGANSNIGRVASMHKVDWNYRQTAVVATLQLSEDCGSNTVAWQRFLPSGPIALLPLSDRVSSLVWTTSPDHAKQLLQISEDGFVDAVNDALWHDRDRNVFVGQACDRFVAFIANIFPGCGPSIRQLPPAVTRIEQNSRAAFPLFLSHSSHYVRQRVALVGDAAHRLHPLAGQGVNLGFGDVRCLAKVLGEAVAVGSDLGSLNHLLKYETEQQRRNLPVLATIHALQCLYSTCFTPVVFGRSLGLSAVDSMKNLKMTHEYTERIQCLNLVAYPTSEGDQIHINPTAI